MFSLLRFCLSAHETGISFHCYYFSILLGNKCSAKFHTTNGEYPMGQQNFNDNSYLYFFVIYICLDCSHGD